MYQRHALILALLALPLAASAQTARPTDVARAEAAAQAAAPVAAPAAAPEFRGFVSFYGGFQMGDGTSSSNGTFSAYNETGSWESSQEYDGGGLFWFGGGARIAGNFGVGAAYSRATDTQQASVTVTAPHPLLYNSPRTVTAEQGAMKHNENAFHLQALYFIPAGERVMFVVSGGPSFFTTTHDFITGAGFAEVGSPYSNITVSNVTVGESDKTITGYNLGAEAAYYITRNVGVGGAFRFTGGSGDMDVAGGGTTKVDVGGPQISFGAQFRF